MKLRCVDVSGYDSFTKGALYGVHLDDEKRGIWSAIILDDDLHKRAVIRAAQNQPIMSINKSRFVRVGD